MQCLVHDCYREMIGSARSVFPEGKGENMSLGARLLTAWGGLVLTLGVLLLTPGPSEASHRLLALTIAATGTAIFLLHGTRRVTATGLFALGTGIFMGYGGWVVAGEDPPSIGLHTALTATALGLNLSLLLMSGRTAEAETPSSHSSGVFTGSGLAAMVVLVLARPVLPSLLAEGAAFMATLIFAVGVIHSPRALVVRLAPLLVLPHVIAYSELFHGSSGRLRLVALLGGLALLYTARITRTWHKPAIIVMLPVALVYLARDRLAFQDETYGPGASAGRSGLESLLTPPRAFGQLVEAQAAGEVPLYWGTSFLSPLTSLLPWSPSSEWAPAIFNYELVRVVHPHLYETGYSTAGSYFGEWWWNFGLVGIGFAALATGPLLGLLDRLLMRTLGSIGEVGHGAVLACAVLAFGGGVADLAWAGPHTWTMRGITRLPLLLVLLPVLLTKTAQQARSAAAPNLTRAW